MKMKLSAFAVVTWIALAPSFPALSQSCDDFQFQGTITGSNADFGNTTVLNDLGNCLAVGGSGEVRVYSWDGELWIPKGDVIEDLEYSGFGLEIAISGDGNVLAIGNRSSPDYRARVYSWTGCNWVQRGQDLFAASTVALNESGNFLITGNDESNGFAGLARIYKFDGVNWIQIGTDIHGENPWDLFGYKVDISSDGSRAVVTEGEGSEDRLVRIYDINETSWGVQSQVLENAGFLLKISSDGNVIAYDSDGGEILNVFNWNGTSWVSSASIEMEYLSVWDLAPNGQRIAWGKNNSPPTAGTSYILELQDEEWVEILELAPSSPGDEFGTGSPISMSSDGSVFARGLGSFVDVWGVNCGLPSEGCTDPAACNYDASATEDDNSCAYGPFPYDCDLNCLNDVNGNGICDEFESGPSFNPDANGDGVIDVTDLLSIIPLFGMPFEADPCFGE